MHLEIWGEVWAPRFDARVCGTCLRMKKAPDRGTKVASKTCMGRRQLNGLFPLEVVRVLQGLGCPLGKAGVNLGLVGRPLWAQTQALPRALWSVNTKRSSQRPGSPTGGRGAPLPSPQAQGATRHTSGTRRGASSALHPPLLSLSVSWRVSPPHCLRLNSLRQVGGLCQWASGHLRLQLW